MLLIQLLLTLFSALVVLDGERRLLVYGICCVCEGCAVELVANWSLDFPLQCLSF